MALNWGQLGKQLTDWGGDYDVFSDYSHEGGARDQAGAKGITGGGAQGQTKPGYDSTGRKVVQATNNTPTQQKAPVVDTSGNGVGNGNGTGGAGGAAAQSAAERAAILREIQGLSPQAQALFGDIFNRIRSVAKGKRDKIDRTYNDQDAAYTKSYQETLPQIDNAFAALGIGNSTYAGDRIDKATEEFKGSLAKSGENRRADTAEVGNWEASQQGAFEADQANINDAIGRSAGVQDVGELRDARNNLTTTVNNTRGKQRALNDDGAAIASLDAATGRSSNFDSAMKSLEGVLASSMDTGTKSAAKTALLENGNLTDEEKKRLSEVQVNNPYGAPVA